MLFPITTLPFQNKPPKAPPPTLAKGFLRKLSHSQKKKKAKKAHGFLKQSLTGNTGRNKWNHKNKFITPLLTTDRGIWTPPALRFTNFRAARAAAVTPALLSACDVLGEAQRVTNKASLSLAGFNELRLPCFLGWATIRADMTASGWRLSNCCWPALLLILPASITSVRGSREEKQPSRATA